MGDLGTVSSLLDENDRTKGFERFLKQNPISAVLVCMGSDAAKAVSKEFRKRQLTFIGLDGCKDEEGYPLIERHRNRSISPVSEDTLLLVL